MATTEQPLFDWLGRVTACEVPPADIIAYNVGLFEGEEGFRAYLIGSRTYDEQDGDWACREDFGPAERYCELGRLNGAGWEDVLSVSAAAIRAFLASEAGKASFLAKAHAVTVGFDDGELMRL